MLDCCTVSFFFLQAWIGFNLSFKKQNCKKNKDYKCEVCMTKIFFIASLKI